MKLRERLLCAGWAGFLVACGLEMVIFGLFDPVELHWRGTPIEWPRVVVYSLGFLLFWLAAGIAGGIALQLAKSPDELNRADEAA